MEKQKQMTANGDTGWPKADEHLAGRLQEMVHDT